METCDDNPRNSLGSHFFHPVVPGNEKNRLDGPEFSPVLWQNQSTSYNSNRRVTKRANTSLVLKFSGTTNEKTEGRNRKR